MDAGREWKVWPCGASYLLTVCPLFTYISFMEFSGWSFLPHILNFFFFTIPSHSSTWFRKAIVNSLLANTPISYGRQLVLSFFFIQLSDGVFMNALNDVT